MTLQVKEKERECIHVLPSLVAHAVGYEMAVSAHNTVYALTCLKGCKVSVYHSLVAPSCRCAGYGKVRSSVLRLTWAPYLICSACSLGLHRAGVPGRSFPVVPDHVSRERAASRGPTYPWSEKGVRWGGTCDPEVGRVQGLPLEVRGAGWEPDRGLGLLLCIWAGLSVCCRCAACWAKFCREAGPLATLGLWTRQSECIVIGGMNDKT